MFSFNGQCWSNDIMTVAVLMLVVLYCHSQYECICSNILHFVLSTVQIDILYASCCSCLITVYFRKNMVVWLASEWWVVNDVERIGRGLVWVIIPEFFWRDWEKSSSYLKRCGRSKGGTSLTRSRRAAHLTAIIFFLRNNWSIDPLS